MRKNVFFTPPHARTAVIHQIHHPTIFNEDDDDDEDDDLLGLPHKNEMAIKSSS